MPGTPDYLEWIQVPTPEAKREILSRSDFGALKPNPDLVYDSHVTEFDTNIGHDGVAVTHVKA